MKKIFLLLAVVLFSISVIFLVNNLYNITKSKDESVTSPKLQSISLDGLRNQGNIVSLNLVDKNKVIATLDPKPNIISFDFNQKTGFQISNIYHRENWKLNDIEFVDTQCGFAVGNYGTVLKTLDGGITWTQFSQFSEFDLQQVKFLNQSVGYVSGRSGTRNEKTGKDEWKIEIFKTEDGGNSWIKSYHGDNERDVFQIAVLSPFIALASIDGNRLIRTDDGGENWKDVSYNSKEVTSIVFATDNTGWLVGGKGEFLKSEDAGITWQEPNNFPIDLHNYQWWSIDFDGKGNGLVVSEEGITAYTNDGGKTWGKLSQKVNDTLRLVRVKDGMGVILGSKNIYKVNF